MNYNKIIEKFATKECATCGGTFPNCICDAKGKMPNWYEPDVIIGDVLEKIRNTRVPFPRSVDKTCNEWTLELIEKWVDCGDFKNPSLTKSLQQILSDEVKSETSNGTTENLFNFLETL